MVLGSEKAVLADLNDDVRDVFQFSIPPHGKVALKEITRRAVRQVERQMISKSAARNRLEPQSSGQNI